MRERERERERELREGDRANRWPSVLYDLGPHLYEYVALSIINYEIINSILFVFIKIRTHFQLWNMIA